MELVLARMRNHYAIPADSGVSCLTRQHLFYALLMSGCPERRANAWIALCDRARERMLYERQSAARERKLDMRIVFMHDHAARTGDRLTVAYCKLALDPARAAPEVVSARRTLSLVEGLDMSPMVVDTRTCACGADLSDGFTLAL